MKRKNAWNYYSPEERKRVEDISRAYCHFLDCSKTERECAAAAIKLARSRGYRNLETIKEAKEPLRPGDKVYACQMDKTVALFQIGTEPFEKGINILGAHIDSPRIDIKQIPLYEEQGHAYLDTHYYGGVKKYQWLALPLAIHGVVVRKDGTKVEIKLGEKEKDPVFVITDLLPHLGRELGEKKVKDFINAEKMDLLIGNLPAEPEEVKKNLGKKDSEFANGEVSEETEKVKMTILKLLREQYQIKEEDFISAELEVVPAGKARDCGLDRSMILGYGQDDRSCAFTSLLALLELKMAKRTSCCLLVDKEEVGSTGATGMRSKFFENTVAELMELCQDYSELKVRRALSNSKMLSSDVSAAYDPMFDEYYERKNSAYLANGLVFNKYSGSGGKSGGNDANAEYMAELRQMMEKHKVIIQTAELGAVDKGGGGTIAYLMADYGMDVIDCGIPVLSMHAPWEVSSKADIYEALKGYLAFLKEA
ncbi:aminopeptidase [Faecalicatena contorta]|uniref:M18 family aminopeptidase n=1 Tax=Faecalicatena contorta TaxID=39482 RepID=A0A316ANJ1_9FIRM|nr:aminopeptidase [Faecalicatena contorta]PWJ51627.1 aspartyl aminopeptidase [Faecalicatena contorta]SUQ13183.1 Aspartyl aminopeptidase [Faecalicatena contorta]